jgi:hypothetical protein
MSGVQVCHRCGSIGEAESFVSLSATLMNGRALVMPQLITERAYQRGVEESEDEEEQEPRTNTVLCRNCKFALRSFLQNEATTPAEAGPISRQRALPKAEEPQAESPY